MVAINNNNNYAQFCLKLCLNRFKFFLVVIKLKEPKPNEINESKLRI